MNIGTLTPYEAACEFLRVIREGDYDPGDYDGPACWSVGGQAIAWHYGWDMIADFGLATEDDEALWLDRGWLTALGVSEPELADACPLFVPSGDISIPRTRLLDALDATTTSDAGEFCLVSGIDRRDRWVTQTLSAHGLIVGSKEYAPLHAAAHSTDEGFAIALLQTGLPLEAIIQLCALPPMPLEYAIAIAGGAA